MSNLPYDAQIEYLEGTGTQYINTGFTNTKSTEFVMDFQLTDATGDRKAIGQGFKFGLGQDSNKWRIIDSQWYNTGIATDTNRHIAHTDNGKYYIDSILIADRYSQKTAGTYSMLLFAVSSQNSISPDGNCAKMKLYSCKIYDDGVLVRDFIPVRVGQVGYLYDKITEELFGNAGTGSFTLGNDVVWSYGRNVVKGFRRRLLFENYSKLPNYLCFTALESGTFTLTIDANLSTSSLQYIEYSLDGNTWVKTDNVNSQSVTITTPTITAGNKVYWKGIGNQLANRFSNNPSVFSSTCRFNASGEVMSLLKGENFTNDRNVNDSAFARLFKDCSTIVNAKDLMIEIGTIGSYGLQEMFINCTSLVTTPYINDINAVYTFNGMFKGCSSLVEVTYPLPVPSTIGNRAYRSMFEGCSSLVKTPDLPLTEFGDGAYSSMFAGCTSLVSVPRTLPAKTLTGGCYGSMFANCTSLASVPIISATKMGNNSCDSMFKGCTSLTTVPYDMLLCTELASNCYTSMFWQCSNLTNMPKLPATTLYNGCYQQICRGTKVSSIELPALTLASSSYYSMFHSSSYIQYVKMLATDISASNCLGVWMYNVPNVSTSIFVKHIDAQWTDTGNNGVPTNWTIIYYDPAVDKYYTDQTRATECDDHGNPI